jgi:arabinofuranosyltransferase
LSRDVTSPAFDACRSSQWLPAGLALVAVFLRLSSGVWPIDDAYITFRYARNLASGLGFVYNTGQFVLGTSTPLFTLLLALLSRLTHADMPHIAVVISAVADGLGTFFLYRLARRLNLSIGCCVLCALSWVFYPLSLKYALGGMETSLVSALILGAYLAWLSGSDSLAMALTGIAVLARPDALAAAFTILIGVISVRRFLPWRPVASFASVLAPWLIFATWRYGSPLPQSLQAKSHAIYLVSSWENARQIGFHLGGLLLGSPTGLAAEGLALFPREGMSRPLIVVALVLFVVWIVGAERAIRLDKRWAAVFAFPIVFAGTYALIGLRGRLMAEWYLVPLTPFWLLGLFTAVSNFPVRLALQRREGWSVVFGAPIVLAQIAGLNWGRDSSRAVLMPKVVWTEREMQYRQAVEFLRPRLRAGDVVAASEIGTIGYYCECRILDTVGLVSPEAVRYYPLPRWQYVVNYAVPPGLVRDADPAYLVSLDVFVRASLLRQDWFNHEYQVVWELSSQVFGSRKLLVFSRKR